MQLTSRPVASASMLHARPAAFRPANPAKFAPQLPARQQRQRHRVLAQAAAETIAQFPRWDLMYQDMVRKKLVSLEPQDAQVLVRDGKAVLVDVRPKNLHEKGHPEGAVNCPVFQTMDLSQPSFGKLLKTAAMALNGVTPTEYNPQFLALVKEVAADGKAVILACEAGGTMSASTNFPTGKASRSLKAAWKVMSSGAVPLEQCYHLEGGVYRWFTSGLPMVGDYDASNVGRTPAAAESK